MLTTIKPEIRDKWADALESGEYQQGHAGLRTLDTYCCLGVLCDLFQKETGQGEWQKAHYADFNFVIGEEEELCWLPEAVCAWSGMGTTSPALRTPDGKDMPAYKLNDGGVPFSEIAALIRKLPGE